MDFGFSDEQGEIQSTARQFLGDRFKPEVVRELAEAGRYEDAHWREICELGWPGIAIGEQDGGQGLGIVELAILCEEVGYACAPVPFLSNAAAGLALAAAGSDEQRARLLAGSASGEARGTAGLADAPGASSALTPDVEGAAFVVLIGAQGAMLSEEGAAEIEPLDSIDSTRSYATVGLGGGETMPGDAARARDLIAVATAAELTGVAQRAMDMAVAYAKDRHQFGRPIGAYQAVSHACARMLYEVEESRSLTYFAAWAADDEPSSLPLAAAMAKARASEAAWSVVKSSLQVHGGIGFTWEHDLHFLLKRARATARLYGTARAHRDRVAALAGLG